MRLSKRGSRSLHLPWIPAFAGNDGLLERPSGVCGDAGDGEAAGEVGDVVASARLDGRVGGVGQDFGDEFADGGHLVGAPCRGC